MKLVLDANVFANKRFCNWLGKYGGGEKILPCAAYLELVYHHLRRGKSEDLVDRFLERQGIVIAPFDAEAARAAARAAAKRWDFKEKARDYTIGATALAHSAKLVTHNKKDFRWLPENSVLSPDELLKLRMGASKSI